jgi:hypothetical protein
MIYVYNVILAHIGAINRDSEGVSYQPLKKEIFNGGNIEIAFSAVVMFDYSSGFS